GRAVPDDVLSAANAERSNHGEHTEHRFHNWIDGCSCGEFITIVSTRNVKVSCGGTTKKLLAGKYLANSRLKLKKNGCLTGQRAFGRGFLGENQVVRIHCNMDRLALVQGAAENLFGQRIFQVPLDGSPHWACAVLRVVALFDQEVFRLLVQLQRNVFGL